MSERKSKEAGVPADAADYDGDFQTAFWSAKHALAHAGAAAFAQHGVHEGQQFVLRCLWREDGLSPGEIARRLGLLRREPHLSDRRLVRLRLTDRGRKLEKIIDEETRQLTERALATLSAAEREALVAALEQIRRNLTSG
jgi:MarR family transcriptional regulator, organic hydroperoxide resistance regulator